MRVWRCCWTRRCSRRLRATLSVHCTVLCKIICPSVPVNICMETLHWGSMTACVVCFSMNDNEGVAEMLIDSMGTTIVNATDSKGRWDLNDVMFIWKLSSWTQSIIKCVCVGAGPPFMLQLFLTMWSVSPSCWATEPRPMWSTHTCAGHHWWWQL